MYELLASEVDSIKPPGCRRADGGWKEEGLSRDHLAADSVGLVQASPSICASEPVACLA